jgi:2-methylcitrate dehydratase PrpD
MSDDTSASLAARLEELSSVAVRSGASSAAIAQLLESASVATIHAIALDLFHSELMEVERPPFRRRLTIASAALLDAA